MGKWGSINVAFRAGDLEGWLISRTQARQAPSPSITAKQELERFKSLLAGQIEQLPPPKVKDLREVVKLDGKLERLLDLHPKMAVTVLLEALLHAPMSGPVAPGAEHTREQLAAWITSLAPLDCLALCYRLGEA